MQLPELLGFGLYGAGFIAALANLGGAVIPLGVSSTGQVYAQWGDIVAWVGAGILFLHGHNVRDRHLEYIAVGLFVLDLIRITPLIGSPLQG
jgi:hypothetical protein